MSLVDALLLDPVPGDIWIALRADGALGSGTENDPFDGSTVSALSLTVSSLTNLGVTATATCSGHPFKTGDVVLISGVDDPVGSFYNGSFFVTSYTSTTFSYALRGDPGGSATTSGTIHAEFDPYRFDAVMRALSNSFNRPITVRIGPGIFETKGYVPQAPASWRPRCRVGGGSYFPMKIRGSGIDVTTLKLVGAIIDDNPNCYVAIGTFEQALDGFEACDFTVDCNVGGHLTSDTPPKRRRVSCGAISVAGKHTRIRDVRAINFGAQSPNAECFVITAANAHPDFDEILDCVIGNCIVEQPGLNNVRETTCIIMSASESQPDGIMAFPRGCVIRNNLVNCEYRENPVRIASVTIASGIATVTTRTPHGRANNAWVRVSGAMVNGTLDDVINGSHQITRTGDQTFTYAVSAGLSGAAVTGDLWVGRFSSLPVQIWTVEKTAPVSPETEWKVTVTTLHPHFRIPTETVSVNQVTYDQVNNPGVSKYNGVFVVDAVASPTQFSYKLASEPEDADNSFKSGFIGVAFQAMSNGGTAAVVERNRILNCAVGGPYHDTFTSRDMVVRENYYRGVIGGVYENLDPTVAISQTTKMIPLVSLTNGGSGAVATAVAPYPHGLNTNEQVIISGATGVSGSLYYNSPTINGLVLPWTITLVDSITFTYRLDEYEGTGTPSGPASGAGYATTNPDRQRILDSLSAALESGAIVATAEIQTALFTAHGLRVGDVVYITRADKPQYNGYFVVTGLPAGHETTQFKFALLENPAGAATTGYFGRLWQMQRLSVQNNIFDIMPTQTNYGPPWGLALRNGLPNAQGLTFAEVVVG